MENPSGSLTPLGQRLRRVVPEQAIQSLTERPTLRLVLESTALVLGIVLLTRLVTVHTQLPDSAYFDQVVSLSLAAALNPAIWVLLILALLLLWRWGDLGVGWTALPHGKTLRVFTLVLAACLVWVCLSQGENYYFARWHLVDRGLMLLLFIMLAWKPVWLLPFLMVTAPLLWQLGAPELGGTIFAHKLQVLYPLMAVTSAFFFYAALGRWPVRALLLVLVAMVGATYWEAAIAKHNLGWMMANELHLMIPAAYSHGWLVDVAPETLIQLVQSVAPLDLPLQVFVMIVEASVLFVLLNRNITVAVLFGLSIFHLGVFAYYGFLFWTWIVVNLALIWVLLKTSKDIYGVKSMLIGAPLILLGSYWSHTPTLGWFDTRLSYTYQLDAVTSEDQQYALSPDYFGAYADVFTMASFSYLSPHAALTGPYGVTTDRTLVERLRAPLSAPQLVALERSRELSDRPLMTEKFTRFVRTYVVNKQQATKKTVPLEWLGAPRQFWGKRKLPNPPPGIEVDRVVVREIVQLFTNTGIQQLRNEVVLTIPMQVATKP